MSVNISKNALNSQTGSDISRTSGTREVMSRLSSGISLPDMQLKRTGEASSLAVTDQSEVSEEAASRNTPQEKGLNRIASMQEEVNGLETIQTALESVSGNLWQIENVVNSAQSAGTSETDNTQSAEESAEQLTANTEAYSQRQQDMQQTTDKYLEGIDHTGSELMDYLQKYMESYELNLDISTDSLGRVDEESSLASLRGDIDLSSAKAADIVAQAREEIASLQVSAEMHRNNMLNDIGSELTAYTSEAANVQSNNGIDNSIQQASDLLLNNPDSISGVSQVNMAQAANLLLS